METLLELEEKEHEGGGIEQKELSPQELLDGEKTVNINITSPGDTPFGQTKPVNLSECPSSYQHNSPQEKQLLVIADNFSSQYSHIFPNRKPLFLCPLNECGVKSPVCHIQKFVSTTLRSTMLPYSGLYDWDNCASFVADHLVLQALDPPIEPPRRLISPTLLLETQTGTCFDISTLLCSLLLGAGYDAYCVTGYAVREMCLLDQSRQECPLLVGEVEVKVEGTSAEDERQVRKYAVKPPRELRSNFERAQQERKEQEARAEVLRSQQEAQRLQEELERPPPDPLQGQMLHCWVLVLAGKREIRDHFFIDPLTGKGYALGDESFLGVEALWNQHNYWVNMQDCGRGCSDMEYNLGDTTMWESVLFRITEKEEEEELEEEEEWSEEPKPFEMPRSWVDTIALSKQDLERRWPGGSRSTQYRKAKLEQFTPYLLPDGLVTRLTTYTDLECEEVDVVREWFQNRLDHLEERELQRATNVTIERFSPGCKLKLKTHSYVSLAPGTVRRMDFHSRACPDGLLRRVESPGQMEETFDHRDDLLYSRHVFYARSPEGGSEEPGGRPLERVVERFHRDAAKAAREDVAERVFLFAEGSIEVTFHLEDDRIIPVRRSFVKPRVLPDGQRAESWRPGMVTGYQGDPHEDPPKNVYLYEMLTALMDEEEKVALQIKHSETEVREILATREREERNPELRISIYDTARNEKVQRYREDMIRAQEESQKQVKKEIDLLAPFLARLGDPEVLSSQQAQKVLEDCLANQRMRMIEQDKILQARYDKETQALQHEQQRYQINQLNMSKEEEERYHAYCSETVFKIGVIKQRQSRHKEITPQKHLALKEKLIRDPRLAPHL
ncbi:dynein regulatory complex subunit 7 isoform X1 [Gadus morhua]|uniref:dynein regulatory complex subunit 7 isoform X1 n=1 Tax=Gadus morhua TaxID=8049 RepID=UPI0011B5AC88|nr:dynein regulatory complex subunit 7 isoform X1 [Gadus morhua]XP_030222883.1 dynein regulatory complex subunit 7 isoform X1 [Gadus morhua]